MPIKTVIFDLDGTITQPFLDFDVIRREMGLPPQARGILEIMEKTDPRQRRCMEAVLERHEREAMEKSTLNPAARETLDTLKNLSIKTAILTRNSRENAAAVVKKHDLLFDMIVGREDGPAKPDAFGVLKICRQLDSTPRQTIVVGDYLHDLLCAKAAGAWAVLFKNNSQSGEFLIHADFEISRLDELPQIIENIP